MAEQTKVDGKKKKQFYHSCGKNEVKRRKLNISVGSKGVIVTNINTFRSDKAIAEFSNILERLITDIDGKAPEILNEVEEVEEKEKKKPVAGKKTAEEKKLAEEKRIEDEKKAEEKRIEEENKDPVDIEKEITAELLAMEEKKKKSTFITEIITGVLFVNFCQDHVPSEIVHKIFSDTLEKEKFTCRFICRLLPLDITFKPYPEAFEKVIRPLLKNNFKYYIENNSNNDDDDENDNNNNNNNNYNNNNNNNNNFDNNDDDDEDVSTWCCIYNTRKDMQTLKKQAVLEILTKYIDKKHKVSLDHPTYVILVEINPVICGVSVIKDYHKFLKYNLHRLCNGDDENTKKHINNKKLNIKTNGINGDNKTNHSENNQDTIEIIDN